MKTRSLAVVLSGVAALTLLAACESTVPTNNQLEAANGHYWQRTAASEAVYQRGPKAQQMLHRDIARCVTEIKELQRLGAIRAAVPANPDHQGNVPNPATPEGRLAGWESPERDGYLRAEHSNYHDFETCMMAKGWERVEHLPYDVATEARETYIETIIGERRRTNTGERDLIMEGEGPYDNLNQ